MNAANAAFSLVQNFTKVISYHFLSLYTQLFITLSDLAKQDESLVISSVAVLKAGSCSDEQGCSWLLRGDTRPRYPLKAMSDNYFIVDLCGPVGPDCALSFDQKFPSSPGTWPRFRS